MLLTGPAAVGGGERAGSEQAAAGPGAQRRAGAASLDRLAARTAVTP